MDDNTERQFRKPMPPSTGPSPLSSSRSIRCQRNGTPFRASPLLNACCRGFVTKWAKLTDHPDISKHVMGPAMMKLSNALADYRDTRWQIASRSSPRRRAGCRTLIRARSPSGSAGCWHRT